MFLPLPLPYFARKCERLHVVLNRVLGFPHVAIGGSCIAEERCLSVPIFQAASCSKWRLKPLDPFTWCLPYVQQIAANNRVSDAQLVRPFILFRMRRGPDPSLFYVQPLCIKQGKSLAQTIASLKIHLVCAGEDRCSVFRKLLLNGPALVVRALRNRPQTQEIMQLVQRRRFAPLQHAAGKEQTQGVLGRDPVDSPNRGGSNAVKTARQHREHSP
jgi:hypothetical protein